MYLSLLKIFEVSLGIILARTIIHLLKKINIHI
jgi:hypothetical protein